MLLTVEIPDNKEIKNKTYKCTNPILIHILVNFFILLHIKLLAMIPHRDGASFYCHGCFKQKKYTLSKKLKPNMCTIH